ncbi:hypothetical protein NM688_g1173 [Phlebia brevispora]|uniref:Uncharacterized protein n=1 Tax=Phlebia brevispora TaxID=194682 RepID=A0ACC1TC93_9APHY|nr:hypothetical protein NM688_g1173 [Phlebia brevispora]
MASEPTSVGDGPDVQHQLYIISYTTLLITTCAFTLVATLTRRFYVAMSGLNVNAQAAELPKTFTGMSLWLAFAVGSSVFAIQACRADDAPEHRAFKFLFAVVLLIVIVVWLCQVMLSAVLYNLSKRNKVVVGIHLLVMSIAPVLTLVGIAQLDLSSPTSIKAFADVTYEVTMAQYLADSLLYMFTAYYVRKNTDQLPAARKCLKSIEVGICIGIFIRSHRLITFFCGIDAASLINSVLTIGTLELNAALYPSFVIYLAQIIMTSGGLVTTSQDVSLV